ncbi:MAG: tetratricopeptide repeat protein [Dyella sp.]
MGESARLNRRFAVALQQAMQAHQSGDLDTAERLYRGVLGMRATQPDALHYLGVLLHQRGQSEKAIELVRQSLRITPHHADAHSNLGNIYKECGRLAEAEASYRQALDLMPRHPQALGNLTVVLQAQERVDEARLSYAAWLESYPDDVRAHHHYGRFLCTHPRDLNDVEQSLEYFRTAFLLDGDNLCVLEDLGVTLYALGHSDEAAAVYRDWAARDPDDPIPRHMLAACGGAEAPPRAEDAYVRDLFDRFAGNFDEQLLKNLGYRAPQVLIEALGAAAEGEALDVLDAGCGTGLCGPLIRARARQLVGVDLSAGMLEQARLRYCYDALVESELSAYLLAHPRSCDLVVCADTLVYFGDLGHVLLLTYAALRPGGRLAFSLEALVGADYELSPSGRYRHARSYVEKTLAAAGFVQIHIAEETLRKEAGRWVDGWVVLARRAA